MRRIDLHTHSHYSDGTVAPAEVARRAAKRRVELLALTDHDSVDGVAEARAEAERQGLAFVAGIEINTIDDNVHILGLGVDPASPALAASLEEFRRRRVSRIRRIVERIAALGVAITFEEVEGGSKRTLGRPHVADALVRKGYVQTRQEAFQRYLVRGQQGYVEPMGPTAAEAIKTIREAGGFAALAHPGFIQADQLKLSEWTAMGLEGLEAYYLSHTVGLTQSLLGRASEHGLIATGGSDFHGPGTGREKIGGVDVPDEAYERLVEKLA